MLYRGLKHAVRLQASQGAESARDGRLKTLALEGMRGIKPSRWITPVLTAPLLELAATRRARPGHDDGRPGHTSQLSTSRPLCGSGVARQIAR